MQRRRENGKACVDYLIARLPFSVGSFDLWNEKGDGGNLKDDT